MATAAVRQDAPISPQYRMEMLDMPVSSPKAPLRSRGRKKQADAASVEALVPATVQLELKPVKVVPAPPPALVKEPPQEPSTPPAQTVQAEPFSRWLLDQKNRRDWIADLAKAAAADRGFPKSGTPDDVRARLQVLGADGDAFEQVDDAERAWMAEEQLA